MIRIIVVYDIKDNKRRRKIGDILEGYGKRVNFSVFECELKHSKQRKEMENDLREILNEKEDSLRLYSICKDCIKNSYVLTNEPQPFEKNSVYFF